MNRPEDAHVRVDMQSKHIVGLDGLRGLAICLVLFSHSVIFDQFQSISSTGLQAGYAGVTIFFVLSGYLITRLLLIEELKTERIDLKLFYIRRILRLFPALWLYLGALSILSIIVCVPETSWHSIVTSLFYIRNLVGHGHETNHLWSLSLEEQFYTVWPLFIIVCRNSRTRIAGGFILFCAVSGWRYLAAYKGYASFGALHIRTDLRFDAPLMGCLLAMIEFEIRKYCGNLHLTCKTTSLCALLGTVILVLQIRFGTESRFSLVFGPTIAASCGVLFILSQIGQSGRITRAFTVKPMVMLGKISYGVYLWQQMFLGPRIPIFRTVRSFPLDLVVTLLIALISYRIIEKPALRLKDRFFQPKQSVTLY